MSFPSGAENLTYTSLRDALRRHEQVHSEPKRSNLGRGGRACVTCAAAKRKCSGAKPCSACQKRSIDCSYAQVTKARRTEQDADKAGSATSSRDYSDTASDDEELQTLNRAFIGSGESVGSTSPRVNGTQQQIITRTEDYLDQGTGFQNSNSTLGSFVPTAQYRFGEAQVSPHQSRFRAPSQYSTIRLPTSFMRHGDNGGSPRSPAAWVTSESVPLNLNNTLTQTLGNVTGADPRIWPPSSSLSINWLPEDWLPDFQMDVDLPASDHGAQTQMINVTAMQDSFQSSYTFPQPLFQPTGGVDTSSPESQGSQGTGRFYVDGEGARLPHVC